jgi:formate dehydrogenase
MRLDLYQNGPHRLQTPLRRKPDGSHEPIDWDTAIAEIAAKASNIAAEHGGEKILYYGGGGQGNHLGGAYSGAFRKALGMRYSSNALAQEKTGEGWVDVQLYGGHTRGEFEHAEVSVFIGKNPWMSQSFPRARTVLKEISKDPQRSMIVLDPVLTDTAKLADFHLRVKPGSDAWCIAALGAVLVQEGLTDEQFIEKHVNGADAVKNMLKEVPIADYAGRCGVDESMIRAAARRIAGADSVAVFEDLGVQQAPNSTLCSYLNKMLWILTGSFAKPGSQHLHSWFGPLFGTSKVTYSPVTKAAIYGGLMPCNVIPDEILTDHPDRFRGLIVESSNPAHSLADSERMREALEALELLVVIDVTMTETGRLADYVLPAASQFEKPEATFFNLEFPANNFHLRHALMEPLEGTLPEPEIWTRLVRALDIVSEQTLAPLRQAAAESRAAYAQALMQATITDPSLAKVLPYVLYETLGPTLPEGLKGAAAVWGLAQRAAMTYPAAVQRAGHADGDALFDAILEGRSGITFTLNEYEDDFGYITHADKRIALEIPELIAAARALRDKQPGHTTSEFPYVLSVGERRSYTANDIFRNPDWRKRDGDGALRISVTDASALGFENGGRARITTARGSAEASVEITDAMQPGHASLPNGLGLDFTDASGVTRTPGVAPNSLTSSDWRDEFAGTPWHKHVPARIELIDQHAGVK